MTLEETIRQLELEIEQYKDDIATLMQEHQALRARNERLEAEISATYRDYEGKH